MTEKILQLAKVKLKEMNDARENERDWPAGQEWDDLVGSSKIVFIKQACEELGISPDVYFGTPTERPFYDRTRALEMLYELDRQGYTEVRILLAPEGLYIACHGSEIPEINGDFVEDWATAKRPAFLDSFNYWWLFD